MTEIGYATLPIIPSLKGSSAQIQSQLSGMLGRSSEAAGMKAGQQIGAGVNKGTRTSIGKSSEGLFASIGEGAQVAGVGMGKRFGTAFRSTTAEYMRTIGGAMLGFMAVEKVTEVFHQMIDEARESERVGRLTAQVIKSTGGAAHVTADQVGELSNAISQKAGIDDETIQSGANLMLTFRNIRNEAGKGNDMFNQSVRITTDMAAAMAAASGSQIDLRSTTIQVGKALNDPARGMSMLSRSGVTFTKQQIAQAKAMQANGNIMGAQRIVMRELTKEFGGAAAAMATPADKLRVAWSNTLEAMGLHLLPVIDKVATAGLSGLSGVASAVSKIPGPVRTAAAAFLALKAAQSLGVTTRFADAMGTMRANITRVGGSVRTLGADLNVLRMAWTRNGVAAREAGISVSRVSTAASRVGGALRGVGRTAAGLGAIAVASTGVADKVGMTNTATLALAGSMAGPLGAAVGTVAGLMLDGTQAAGSLAASYDALANSKGLSDMVDNSQKLRAQLYDLTHTKAGDWGDAWHDTLTEFGMGLRQLTGGPSKADIVKKLHMTLAQIDNLRGSARNTAAQLGAYGAAAAKAAKRSAALHKEASADVSKFQDFSGAVTRAKGSVAGFEHQLAMQAKAMRNFARNSVTVANSGVKGVRGLIRQLAAEGPAGAQIMQQLAHGSRKSVAQAVASLNNWKSAGRNTAAVLQRVLGNATARKYLAKLGLNIDQFLHAAGIATDRGGKVGRAKWLAHINADIGGLLANVNRAQNAINSVHDRTVWVRANYVGNAIGAALNGHATGGYVSGPGTGTSDSITARLSNGEYVVKARQTAKYRRLLDAINYGTHGYAYGGLVSPRGGASVPVSTSAGGGAFLPSSLTLSIGEVDFEAYVNALVDDRMSA